MPVLTNKWLWAAVSVSLLLQIIILYTPLGTAAFDTTPLDPAQWGILAAGLAVGFIFTIVIGQTGSAPLRPPLAGHSGCWADCTPRASLSRLDSAHTVLSVKATVYY